MRDAAVISYFIGAIGLAGPAVAEVALDGTLGPGGPLQGPAYQIGAALGRQSGPNLFHSFQRFSVASGESATFSGPGSVANVIARVTGGSESTIDGTLRSTIPGANLYLFNPTGIAFGPNARLDIQGSFHAATADELSFDDGAKFSATNPTAGTLTTAAPAAFGFLGPSPAALAVNGSQLQVPLGADLGLTAGLVDISRAELSVQGGRLELTAANNGQAPAGAVVLRDLSRLAARPGPRNGTVSIRGGQIVVDAAQIDAAADPTLPEGGIALAADSSLVVRNTGTVSLDTVGGTAPSAPGITITAAQVEIAGGQVTASTSGLGRGGSIAVFSAGLVHATGAGADDFSGLRTLAKPGSLGAAGDISVLAAGVAIESGAAIDSTAQSLGRTGAISVGAIGDLRLTGNDAARPTGISTNAGGASTGGGAITITAGRVAIDSGAAITTATQSVGPGGDISVFAVDTVRLAGSSAKPATIASETRAGAPGKAGDVSVVARGVAVAAGGVIASRTLGPGDGGAVSVSALDQVSLDGGDSNRDTGLSSIAAVQSSGAAGALTVAAPSVTIAAGAQINGNTLGAGDGATIRIAASDSVRITGSRNATYTGLSANGQPGSTGDAGAVIIETGTLALENGGIIGSVARSTGRGGDIKITARDAVTLTGGTAPFTGLAASAEGGSAGDAGTIAIETRALTVANLAQISTSTLSVGGGGDITITASERVAIIGRGTVGGTTTGIFSNGGSGSVLNAGDIDIATGALLIDNVGEISSSASSDGNGGNVRVTVGGELRLAGRNQVGATGIFATSQRGAGGRSGAVQVAAGSIALDGGAEISTSTFGRGPGGDLVVTAAGPVTVAGASPTRPSAIAARSGSNAPAGNVALTAASLTVREGAGVTTQALTAAGGNMQIQVGELLYLVGGSITTLVQGGFGGGGNIQIVRPDFAVLNRGRIVADAQGGNGGNITIDSAQFLRTPDSVISASSALALPGVITILAPEVDVSGGLVQISAAFLDAAGLLRDSCAARGGGPGSSLLAAGRGGLPLDPDGSLTAYQPLAGQPPTGQLLAEAALGPATGGTPPPAPVTVVTAWAWPPCHIDVSGASSAGPRTGSTAKKRETGDMGGSDRLVGAQQ